MTGKPGRFLSKRSAISVVAELQKSGSAPLTAMVEIADRCNEVCVHCYQVQGQKGEMSTEQVKRLFDELAEMGVLFLTLSGGEATLRSDFLELTRYAREKRFAVKLYSNGLRIDEALADELAALAVQEVQISLYSHQPDVQDWVTRVPGSFERTVQAAKLLLERGVHVVMKSPVMNFNVEGYRDFIAFVKELGADFSLDPVMHAREDDARDPEAFSLTSEDYVRVMSDPVVTPAASLVHTAPRPCGACASVHVEANGELRPCAMWDVPLGNVTEQPLDAAWSSPLSELVRGLGWADIHGCRDCDLRAYCGRCFASARQEAADALAPYPGACRRARLHHELVEGQAPAIVPERELGPFRKREDGSFEPVQDELTEADRALHARYPWLLREAPAAAPASAAVGQLVQIRRPGKRSREERIPATCATRRE